MIDAATIRRDHAALRAARAAEPCDDTDRPDIHPGMCVCRMAALIDGPPRAWPRGWKRWPVTLKAHRQRADAFLHALPPYPGGFAGRGVVIAAGGKYLPGAYVAVRMLRATGCTLPVQVWYFGERERRAQYETLLPDVQFVDITVHPAYPARRIVNGFESKLFAVLNSPFEEVLSLDADCYPCADPAPLFNDAQYRDTGGIYWPDLPETDAWTDWEFWGVPRHGPACGFETGQYVVNKRTAWRQLKLAEWYDDHSDWCYGVGSGGDHGDKGPHRVAWAKTRTAPAVFDARAVWRHPAFLQNARDGSPLFVHRCRSKLVTEASEFYTPQTAPNLPGGLPGEAEAFGLLDDLRRALA